MRALIQLAATVGLALSLGGCAAQPRTAEALPHPAPAEGQLAVSLTERLRVGANRLRFAVVRVHQGAAQAIEDPRLGAEVRFFHNRPPQGDADASARASFVAGDPRGTGEKEMIATNFVADLYLPDAGGGNLQFVIREPNGARTTIGMPVRVEPSGSAAQ